MFRYQFKIQVLSSGRKYQGILISEVINFPNIIEESHWLSFGEKERSIRAHKSTNKLVPKYEIKIEKIEHDIGLGHTLILCYIDMTNEEKLEDLIAALKREVKGSKWQPYKEEKRS